MILGNEGNPVDDINEILRVFKRKSCAKVSLFLHINGKTMHFSSRFFLIKVDRIN